MALIVFIIEIGCWLKRVVFGLWFLFLMYALTAVEPGGAVFAHITIGLSGFGAASTFDLVLLEVVQLGDAGLVEGELLCFDRFHND